MASILPEFDAIRIVSLADRVDRRAQLREEFARVGMPVGQGPVRLFDAIRPADAGGFPSVGAHGCFLSHLEVLRQARDAGVQRLLVLEDDALFTPLFGKADALIDFCRSDEWDLLYPGHILPAEPGPLRWIRTAGGLQCTHAYAVRGEVIPALIHFLEAILSPGREPDAPGPMHVDAAYNVFMVLHPAIRTFRASKAIVIQRSSKSDVSRSGRVDEILPAGMLSVARGLKSWVRARR